MASWRAFHIRNSKFLRRQAGDVNRAVGADGHAPPRSLAAEIEFAHDINHHLFGLRPQYYGLFEDNDPKGRLMAIANYNNNLAEYWQMAGVGFFPIDSSNEAFKLGVNYMLYGLTH